MKIHNTTQTLLCKLTRDEVAQKAKQLSEKILENAKKERELENTTTNIKAEISSIEADIALLTDKVFGETEYRLVEVRVEYDFEKGVKSFVRLDTGEIFNTDKISDAERQQEFKVV